MLKNGNALANVNVERNGCFFFLLLQFVHHKTLANKVVLIRNVYNKIRGKRQGEEKKKNEKGKNQMTNNDQN